LDEKNFNHVFLLGDVLHDHDKILVQTLNRVLDFLEMISSKTKLIILVGNHDMINNKVYCDLNQTWMRLLSKWESVRVIYKPTILTLEEGNILALPYLPPNRFLEALKDFEINLDNIDMIFAHQEFKGCQMGCIESKDADEYNLNIPCFSGHIHDNQQVGKVEYVGAAFEHTFGSKQCWFYIIHNSNKFEKIPSTVVSKKIFTTHLTNGSIENMNLPKNVEPILNKLVVKCKDNNEFNTWLKSVEGQELKNFYTISFKPEKNIDKNIVQKIDSNDLLKSFESKLTNDELIFFNNLKINMNKW